MYVVPYISKPLKSCTQVWLFLERNGTHLIDVDDAAAFAIENGLADDPTIEISGDLAYLRIDSDRPGLSSFYSWEEVVPGTIPAKELWRPFIWLPGTEHLLAETRLSANHTALTVIEGILSHSAIESVDECPQ